MEYVCQFNESYFQFLSRWMERYGLYYFFEQGQQSEKLVITDTAISHNAFQGSALSYLPVSGLDDNVREDVIYNFIAEYGSVPKNVLLKDYNYQHPTLNMQGQADVLEMGVGTHYTYGDNFQNPQEAGKLAQIRAQAFQCRQTQMHGESQCLGMVSGYSFTLQDHFHSEFNGDYLLTKVSHTARNRTAFTTAMSTHHQAEEKKSVYTNTFTSIPLGKQFRPAAVTENPHFFGLLSAHIDAAGSGKYAQLDQYGRYKVILPFDLSGRKDGKASSWIRLAEPYAGANYGIHFPLLKGTEVLISFVEGDIDRPVITSAIHNFENKNHVKDSNQPINSIHTAGGNQLVLGDSSGKGFMGMRLPNSQGGFILSVSGEGEGSGAAGSHSTAQGKGGDDRGKNGGDDSAGSGGSGEKDGGSGKEGGGEDSHFMSFDHEHTESSFSQKTELVGGTSTEIGLGVKNELFIGGKSDITAGLSWGADVGTVLEYTWGDKVVFGSEEFICSEEYQRLLEKEYSLLVGPQEALVASMNSLRNSFKAIVAASLTSASTTYGTFKGEFGNKEDLNGGFGSWASITSNIVSGLDLCFGASVMAYVHSLLKTIEEIAKNSPVSTAFQLSKNHGASISVNSIVGAGAKIDFTVGTPGVDLENSSISIAAKGQSISLKNKANASMTMMGGDQILLQIKPSGGRIELFKNKAVMQCSASTMLTLNKKSISMFTGGVFGPNIELSEESIKATVEETSISLKEKGIILESPTLEAKALADVKITADGLITLG